MGPRWDGGEDEWQTRENKKEYRKETVDKRGRRVGRRDGEERGEWSQNGMGGR